MECIFQIYSLLSFPPEANCCVSGDHFSPQTSCLCPWWNKLLKLKEITFKHFYRVLFQAKVADKNSFISWSRRKNLIIPAYSTYPCPVSREDPNLFHLLRIPNLNFPLIRTNWKEIIPFLPGHWCYVGSEAEIAKFGDLRGFCLPKIDTGAKTNGEDVVVGPV